MAVRFLAELFLRTTYPPELAIAADDVDRRYNVSYFETARPDNWTTSYWTDWGGNYEDLLEQSNVQIILSQFLQRVDSLVALQGTDDSFFVDGTKIYINTVRKPWQYDQIESEVLTVSGFSYSAKDPDNPSDTNYGGLNYPVRLRLPSVNTKLSDSVSGISLFQEWSISFDNQDGYFDDPADFNFFNTPVQILKAYSEGDAVPTLGDFKIIRTGLVNNQKSSFDDFSITASDIWRSLGQDVCNKYLEADFPDAGTSVWGKDIPRLWGSLPDTPLTKISATTFYAGEGITAVSAVYDSDGGSLSFSFNSTTGVITEATGEAKTADITGSTDNMIGQMIVEMLEERANIFYSTSSWDISEANAYYLDSPAVNVYFDRGTVRDFVKRLLSNDDAFLIQKNNGLLTFRKWGGTYGIHSIPSWCISKKPSRDYNDAKDRYLSAIQISYNQNIASKTFNTTYFDDTQEAAIFEEWRRRRTLPLSVDLANASDVIALGDSRLSRFGGYRETVTVGLGYDTSEIELLDTVVLSFIINGRRFSESKGWIVKAINPAQDELVLESALRYDREVQSGIASLSASTIPEDQGLASFDRAASVTGYVTVIQ